MRRARRTSCWEQSAASLRQDRAVDLRAAAVGQGGYEEGARLLDPPSVPIDIPFTHADTSAGDLDAGIPTCAGPDPADGWLVLLFIRGPDAYRTDHPPLPHPFG
ncbi:hypothetical protein ACFY20_41370 [Streptomyces sp. NPDC001312]|uniref:hypothetical protein n=1 Tax=Streptomyces sp. NPDC001312 TaxID=3364561 RepID=UPI0036BA3C37